MLKNVSSNYNATIIRELMANDGPWEKYVPLAVKDVIKEKGLDKVVKDLFSSNTAEVDAIHKNRVRRGELSYEDFLIQESLSNDIKVEINNETVEK